MDAATKKLLNDFALSQPALNKVGEPAATSAIKLGDEIVAEAAAAQSAATTAAQAYTPATSADWDAPAPTTVAQALDRLAAAVESLLAGPIP